MCNCMYERNHAVIYDIWIYIMQPPQENSHPCSLQQQLFGGLWNLPSLKRMWPQRAASSLIPSLPSSTQLSNSTAPTPTAHCSIYTCESRRLPKVGHAGIHKKLSAHKCSKFFLFEYWPECFCSYFHIAFPVRDPYSTRPLLDWISSDSSVHCWVSNDK